MLEKGIHSQEAFVAGFSPEIVRSEHGDSCQHAKPTGTQPDPASENDEQGAAEFDDDGRGGPKPCRLEAETRLLRNRSGEIERFLNSADQERGDECNPSRRDKP